MTDLEGRDSTAWWSGRRLSSGSAAWLVQRICAVLLLVVLPLKLLSGWALVGKLPWGKGLAGLHTSVPLDVVLVVAVSFHAFFGVRTFLIDSGKIEAAERLTVVLASAAAIVALWALLSVVI